jgi:hypothetical protein
MKATLLEQFGSKQGVKKKTISDARVQKLLKKKRLKKMKSYNR